jgi:hypothetical protein
VIHRCDIVKIGNDSWPSKLAPDHRKPRPLGRYFGGALARGFAPPNCTKSSDCRTRTDVELLGRLRRDAPSISTASITRSRKPPE